MFYSTNASPKLLKLGIVWKTGVTFILLNVFISNNINAQSIKNNTVSVVNKSQPGAFPLVAKNKASTIFFDTADATVVHIAANAFTNDINFITGVLPLSDSSLNLSSSCVIVGTIGKSKLIDQLIQNKKLNTSAIKGKWETFSISVIDYPLPNVEQALVITGSDARGTAFGIFELSRMMGISPFYWWADVVPKHQDEIYLTKGTSIVGPPSVKYRGIFINDEDWGLQPWAAKTFEPETGDIGPKTYAKVFELLLRLKANLIWPAMHPSTKAFYHYPGNKNTAADYAIIVGSSHAEPMLRNNVGEWDEKTMGHFNYITNKENVQKYWEERVKESSTNNAIYTMGMRGVHDSGIEGVKDPKEAVPLIEQIFNDQREMLTRYVNKEITAVPQVFTAYKEVLEIYDNHLKLPDDITLVWPDDNYGYIQRLNNEAEKKRSGGSGVYYHASYWGRPHDYLWLSSTHPALIREEMMKAYNMKADRLWVLNVGDIKPLEYNIEMFMDMAFNATPFKDSRYAKQHLLHWAAKIFGSEKARQIQSILWEYYQLAFERRPEFMGWSQTEPTTKTTYTTYNHFFYGDEAQKRIDRYEALDIQVRALRSQINQKDKDAFFELVYYPVVGASFMNKKFLYRDKSFYYAKQNRLSADDYAQLSKQAYDSIVKETAFYNNKLANGKWENIMSMKPRDLPVYEEPAIPKIVIDQSAGWSIAPEGYITKDSSSLNNSGSLSLPTFDAFNQQQYFIDIFLNDNKSINWTSTTSGGWIKLSQNNGLLSNEFGKKETRILVTIDWKKAPEKEKLQGLITFSSGGKQVDVSVNCLSQNVLELNNYKGYIENNGYVSMHAANYSKKIDKHSAAWKLLDDIGYTGKCLQTTLTTKPHVLINTKSIKDSSSFVAYDFYTFTTASPTVAIYSLPTHPLNPDWGMQYAVEIDNQPLQIVDFRTYGRSEEWKQNVLRNNTERKIQMPLLSTGKHTLKIYSIDPGVILDRMTIDLGGLKKAYSAIPETKK